MALAATHTRFLIDSDTKPGVRYKVDIARGTCDCPARKECKHLRTAREFHEHEAALDTMRNCITPLVERPKTATGAAPAREAAPLHQSPYRGRQALFG